MTNALKHQYKYRPDGSLDDQTMKDWIVTDGGTREVYNPNLTDSELSLLRHIVWALYDVYGPSIEGREVLSKVIHPLMFRNIKWEVFSDIKKYLESKT